MIESPSRRKIRAIMRFTKFVYGNWVCDPHHSFPTPVANAVHTIEECLNHEFAPDDPNVIPALMNILADLLAEPKANYQGSEVP